MATCKRWIKSYLRPYQTMSKKGLFIAFLVIVGFTTIFTTQAFAQVTSADYPDLLDHWYETFAFDMYADALQAGVDDTFGILTLTNDVSSSDVSSIIKVIYDALLALGEALLLTFFLAELTDKMTKQVIDIETMLRMCLKYLIAYALIKNGAMVLESILGIGTKLAAGITDIKFDINDLHNIYKIHRGSAISSLESLALSLGYLPKSYPYSLWLRLMDESSRLSYTEALLRSDALLSYKRDFPVTV